MTKKIYRSDNNKVVSGVCGGLGDYFEIDANLVRVIAVLLFFATKGFALAAYVVSWIIIPKRPLEVGEVTESDDETPSTWHRYLPGLFLIAFGMAMLLWQHWPWPDFDQWWPLLLILVGGYMIFRRRQRRESERSFQVHNQESDLKNGGTVS